MTTTAGPPALPADFSFTFDPELSSWNHPPATWLSLNSKSFDGLVASTVVFHPITNRVLLIQRARHDSGGLSWEVPGGAVDAEDPTILHGAARELWEEAGLKAGHIRRVISETAIDGVNTTDGHGYVFTTRTKGLVVLGWTFEVDVSIEALEAGVKLDPNEHEDFVWASEEEVKAGAVGDKKIPLTSPYLLKRVLEAFRLRKLNGEMAA